MLAGLLHFERAIGFAERRLPKQVLSLRRVGVERKDMIAHRRDEDDVVLFPVGHCEVRDIKRLRFDPGIVVDDELLERWSPLAATTSGVSSVSAKSAPVRPLS